MKLTELEPRWLEKDSRRIGLTFLCPCCRKDWLTCFSEPTPFREQVKIMHAAFNTIPEDDEDWPIDCVPSGDQVRWSLSNTDDFATLSVHPSIDASASGNWHGFITNGEIR